MSLEKVVSRCRSRLKQEISDPRGRTAGFRQPVPTLQTPNVALPGLNAGCSGSGEELVSRLKTTRSNGCDGMSGQAVHRGGISNNSRWKVLCKERGGLEKHQASFASACVDLSALIRRAAR